MADDEMGYAPEDGKPAQDMTDLVSAAPEATANIPLPASVAGQRYCSEMDVYFSDPRKHLEAHAAAAEVTPCKVLGIDYAKYMGTFKTDSEGNVIGDAPRPPEDTELRGWTAQQQQHRQ